MHSEPVNNGKPPKKRKTEEPYTDVIRMQQIMTILINKIKSEETNNSEALCKIMDCSTKKEYFCDDIIRTAFLEKHFKTIGHCFSMLPSYINPLFFDIDCLACKNNEHENYTISTMNIHGICVLISDIVRRTLCLHDIPCMVFKRPGHCGLHLYFDVSVSIFLKHELHNLISPALTMTYSNLRLDPCETIPLPYSAKKDCCVYTSLETYMSFDVFPDKKNYYELNLITSGDIKGDLLRICSFKHQFLHTFYFYLQSDKVAGIQDNGIIKEQIEKLLDKEYYCNDDFFQKINMRLLKKNKYITNDINVKNISIQDNDTIEMKYVKNIYINFVNKIIIKQNRKINPTINISAYFRSFLETYSCRYSFYILMVLFVSLYQELKKSKKNETIDKNTEFLELKTLLINDILLDVCENNNELLYNLDCFREKIDIYMNHIVNDVVKNVDIWIIVLCKEIDKRDKSELTNYLFSKTYKDAEIEIIDLLNYTFYPVKPSNNYWYIYVKSVHKIQEHTDCVSNIKAFIKSIKNGSPELKKEVFTDVKRDAYDLWKGSAKKGILLNDTRFDFRLDACSFMISTTLYGVFNTITGLYMEDFPLNFITVQRSFCLTPHTLEEINRVTINSMILKENLYNIYNNYFLKLKDSIFALKKTIYIEGLKTLDNVLQYNKTHAQSIFNTLFLILSDMSLEKNKYLNTENLYGVFELLEIYDIKIKDIYRVERCIRYLQNENIALDFEDLQFANKETIIALHEFKGSDDDLFPNDIELILDVLRNYWPNDGKDINTLNLVLAIIAIILDSYLPQNPITEKLFKWNVIVNKKKILQIKRPIDIMYDTLHEIFPNEDSSFFDFILLLIYMTNLDFLNLDEFLICFTQLYTPQANRKAIINIVGLASSGKSTLCRIISKSMGSSVGEQPVISFTGNGDGNISQSDLSAITRSVCMSSVYFCQEASGVKYKNTWLKQLTGGDRHCVRPMGRLDCESFDKVLATVIMCGNSCIKIDTIDKALLSRLKFFNNDYKIQSTKSGNILFDMSISRCLPASKYNELNEFYISKLFMNLIFYKLQNLKYHDKKINDLTQFELQNKQSVETLKSFLRTPLWVFLKSCGIYYGNDLTIKYDELVDIVKNCFTTGVYKCGYKSHTQIIEELTHMEEYNVISKTFVGLGKKKDSIIIQTDRLNLDNIIDICDGSRLSQNDFIRNIGYFYTPYDIKSIDDYLEEAKKKYEFKDGFFYNIRFIQL